MAKMRGIKPETWTDEKFVSVSPLARLLFIAMWTDTCDNGHLDDSPVQLKIRLLPMDDCDVPALIRELVTAGLVERHDGFLKVRNLTVHQRIDRRFLLLCDHCAHDEHTTFTEADRTGKRANPTSTPSAPNVHTLGTRRAHHDEGEGEGEGEVKTPSSTDVNDAEFDTWWQHFPRKVGKGQARKAYRTARKKTGHQTLVDAITKQRDQLMAKGPDFCPHPATWLNGERWADEQPTLDERTRDPIAWAHRNRIPEAWA